MDEQLKRLGDELGIAEYMKVIIDNQKEIAAMMQHGWHEAATILAIQSQTAALLAILKLFSERERPRRYVLRSPHLAARLMDLPLVEGDND